jgi:histone H4
MAPKTQSVRHRNLQKGSGLHDLSRAAIQRLARRAGVIRIARTAIEETRLHAGVFLHKLMHDALLLRGSRRTVTRRDVEYSLARMNRTMYGGGMLD